MQQQELAHSPRNERLMQEWIAYGASRQPARPMIRIEIDTFEQDVLPALQRCTGEEARAIERRMLRPIANFTLFADDTLVPDHYAVREHLQFVPFGLPVRRQETGGVGHHFVPYLHDLEEDMHLLGPSVYRVDEAGAQELMDDFVMKLRMARHLRTPEYNALFGGDPMWITEAVGGMGSDGRTLVTKTSFRMLHTLYNLGASPEPNLTILWSGALPAAFKTYCARVSCETDAIQYENDDLMRPIYGDDYAIACCVSAMRLGKDMQFFGARVNLPKLLLLSLNGGRDEMKNMQIGPVHTPYEGEYLEYGRVTALLDAYRPWLAELYADTMNVIHYMHDKYAYESIEMALHDKEVYRTLGCGMSGLSIAADSLSACKYAKVYPIYNKDAKTTPGHEDEYVEGADDDLIVGYRTEGEFPLYGNDDDRADEIAKWVVSTVMGQVKRLPVYRGAVPTQSILTITSNVEYGKATGAFPSGHKKGTPYAPGANPENGMDSHGMLPSMFSVGKIDYNDALDGISLTNTITPDGLGRDEDERIGNLVGILDAGNGHGLYHANINVLRKETMEDAVEHPEKYPHLTVRVSGYAVNFVKLTKEQQLDVISRTFHQGAVVD